MDFQSFASNVRRWAWLLVAGGVLAGAASYGATQLLPRSYVTEGLLLVGTSLDAPDANSEQLDASGKLAAVYTEIAKTTPVLDDAIRDSGVSTSPAELRSNTEVDQTSATTVVSVTVTWRDPDDAAALAGSLMRRLVALAPNTASPGATNRLTIIQDAAPNPNPVAPNEMLNVIIGSIAGVIVAFAIGTLLDRTDGRIRSAEDVSSSTGVPVLGGLPREMTRADAGTEQDESRPVMIAFRRLRTRVGMTVGAKRAAILVTSAENSSAKGVIAFLLAAAFANAGKRVILVDADPNQPAAELPLGRRRQGVTEYLRFPSVNPLTLCQDTVVPGLRAVPVGTGLRSSTELLGTPAMRGLISQLQRDADVLVVNGPPVLQAPEVIPLGTMVDGTVLIVDVGRTRRTALERATAMLSESMGRVLGVVLWGTEDERPRNASGAQQRNDQQRPAVTPEHSAQS